MCSSVQIKSFIFLDLETTGLPHLENNRTKITELCMIGIQTDHLRLGVVPRVQQKLTLCFNPWKRISDKSEEITGTQEKKKKEISQVNSFLFCYRSFKFLIRSIV